LALQPDGKILVCSSLFTGGQVKYNIVRLNASGTVQPPEGARIGALTFLPNGVVQVQVTGGTPNVVIEASADLKTWQTLGTGTVTGGLLTFTDPLAGTSKARFFRLVAAP
jgi:hypothetical protein